MVIDEQNLTSGQMKDIEKVLSQKREPSHKKPKKNKKKIEFSKILFILTSILVSGVVLFSMILMWRTGDTSALAYLIPSAFAELATATGFYYNKAKKENEIKLEKEYEAKKGKEE